MPDNIAAKLLHWYHSHARTLPWRAPPGEAAPDPYRVWLSEVMLQQTQVATVKPYFEKFTARWPSFAAMAAEDDAEVMSAWAGLGYYARARNMLACAREVARLGVLPDSEVGLRALPGIGGYTSAAIAAIAFGRRAVVVDANVERVVSRLFAVAEPLPGAKQRIHALTDSITPEERAGDFAQAMMDLGSGICTARSPRCLLCPLREDCAGFAGGNPEAFPVKAPKAARPQRYGTMFWAQRGSEVLLVRRPDKGLLGGMRALPTGSSADSPPGLEGAPVAAEWRMLDETVSHGFTHFTLECALAVATIGEQETPGEWWPVGENRIGRTADGLRQGGKDDRESRMRVKFLAGLGLLSVAILPLAPVQAQVQPASSVETLSKDYVASGKLSGIVVTIGQGDGAPKVIADGAISFEPGAPKADIDTLWRVYSMTKPITGIAAMILVEEGKLKLDQPISDLLPAFKNMKVMDQPNGPSTATHPARTAITVRHLLTHTAGFGYDLGQPNAAQGSLLEMYRANGINPAQVSASLEPNLRLTRPASLAAFADKLATLPLLAEPGSKWSYSISLDLLGRVIEVASGMPFDAFLQKRIFDPLKMQSTFFTVPGSEVKRYADLPVYMGGARLPLDPAASSVWLNPPSFPYGGAGLVSSARDYDRFLHMLLNGGELDGVRVMKPETVAIATSNLLPADADTTSLQGISKLGGRMGFGAGGSVYVSDATGRESKGTWGWGGAAGTLGWIDPVRKIRAVLMVNYFPAEQYPVRDEITRAVYANPAP